MKIIQSIASLKKCHGGTTFFATNLSRALSKLGTEVSLISEEFTKEIDLYIPPKDEVNTILMKRKKGILTNIYDKTFSHALKIHLKQNALVHVTGLWQPIIHSIIVEAKKLDLPILISPQGMLEPWALKHRFWKKKLAWFLYQWRDIRAAKVIHATAEQEADNLRRLGIKQPIAIIPNGVDFESLKTSNSKFFLNSIAKSHKDNHMRTLLFLSRIHPKKGLIELIEAWSSIRPHGWRVVIAGPDEGGHRAKVESIIANKGLTADFQFVGLVDGEEKSALYRSADLFVLPTFSENFGIVIAEALACGLPVITTKKAPWHEIEKYRCGWWIDTGIKPLASALTQAFASSSEELRKMGDRGRVYAESTFGWAQIAKQMTEVYSWMLNGRERPNFLV